MPGGPNGAGGMVRGGNLEGEVLEVAEDTITVDLGDSGSQTFYITDDTVVAYVEGASPLATGSTVMVMAQPSAAEAVTNASLVVVK